MNIKEFDSYLAAESIDVDDRVVLHTNHWQTYIYLGLLEIESDVVAVLKSNADQYRLQYSHPSLLLRMPRISKFLSKRVRVEWNPSLHEKESTGILTEDPGGSVVLLIAPYFQVYKDYLNSVGTRDYLNSVGTRQFNVVEIIE